MYCEHAGSLANRDSCDKLETGPVLLDLLTSRVSIRYLCSQHTEEYEQRGWYVPTDREIMLRCAPEIASISRNSRENGQ